MKKFIFAALLLIFALMLTGYNRNVSGSGWNYQLFDTIYGYDRAVIELPNGEIIDGKVQSWRDYEDGDQIQVKIDGVTYLVHSSDVVLITKGEG